jgi:hypothetical protein
VATEHVILSSANQSPLRILLYDKHAGGLGLCDELFARRLELLQRALQLLNSCPCVSSSGHIKHSKKDNKGDGKCDNSSNSSGDSRGDSKDDKTDYKNKETACPSCLLDQRCSSYNACLSRRGALQLLGHLIALQQLQIDQYLEAQQDNVPCVDIRPAFPANNDESRTAKRELEPSEGCQLCPSSGPITSENISGNSANVISISTITDDTPRKMRRTLALRNARFNQSCE